MTGTLRVTILGCGSSPGVPRIGGDWGACDPANPKIVHGFLRRDAAGIQIVETWDTIGMRATQSHDTVLTNAVCPDELVVRVCAPGMAGADLFHVAIFAWALTDFAAVYDGIARRAFELTVEALPAGQPADFAGLIGPLGVRASLDRERIALGEGAVLSLAGDQAS